MYKRKVHIKNKERIFRVKKKLRKIRTFFEPKNWWKDVAYWLLKSSCFELFRNRKFGLFSAIKLIERWYLLITEKFLFWTFRRWEIRSFFEPKRCWKDDIYWLLKSFCFELFGHGKYGLFFSQKADGKMMFTWSFWAFHDTLGLGKNGFSCSENIHLELPFPQILLTLTIF